MFFSHCELDTSGETCATRRETSVGCFAGDDGKVIRRSDFLKANRFRNSAHQDRAWRQWRL